MRAEQETSKVMDDYTQRATAFLLDSLKDPASDDHASLEDCWNIISRLETAADFKQPIEQQVAQAQGRPGFELLSAWIVVNPAAASDYIRAELGKGNAAVLQSLIRQPQLGTALLLETDITNRSVDFDDATLLLLRNWGGVDPQLLPVYEALARSTEPDISLRAIGYLLSLDKATDEQLANLRSAIGDETQHFMAAMEGGKISADPRLSTAFIPRVRDVALGELDPGLAWEMQPYFSAYALAYIPGSEAQVIRSRLLGAANPDLRWQARFGQLMQGDPTSFHEAMLSEGVLSPYILKCLGPPEAVHPELLPWYEKAIAQSEEAQRFQLVSQLNRYNEHSSNPELRRLVLGLLEDNSSLVRGQAWLLAAQFGFLGRRAEAAKLLASDTEQAFVKAAAACYLLKGNDGSPAFGS